MIILAFVLAWCIERAHMIMGAVNYGTIYNGFGAIESVNQRKTLAPMAYRVLVPWLIFVIELFYRNKEKARQHRITWYQGIKIVLTALALFGVMKAWSIPVAMLVTVMLALTFKHDYWDYATELIGIGFAMTGDLALAVPGAILHGLSRETVLLAPAAYLLRTGDWVGSLAVGLAAGIPLLIVRLVVGKRKLYCDRWMWKINLAMLKDIPKWIPVWYGDITISLGITAVVMLSIIFYYRNLTNLIPFGLTLAGWLMAKADEPRVFIGAFPWVASAVLQWCSYA